MADLVLLAMLRRSRLSEGMRERNWVVELDARGNRGRPLRPYSTTRQVFVAVICAVSITVVWAIREAARPPLPLTTF